MSILFSNLLLQNQVLQNRLVVSPMCQYSAEDGFANEWHYVHLGQFAIGKAGAIIQEATAITPEGRISYGDLGIWKDEHIPSLKNITKFIHKQGGIIGIQLAHAGRKASTDKPWISREQFPPIHPNGWQTVAPSPIPFRDSDYKPIELTITDIKNLVKSFKDAAKRAIQAEYDIIEIHAAHGYLIHQFLSPLSNQRNDIYGGSFENRIRFLLEIIEAVSEELLKQSLWLRISATDWADGGWSLEESLRLSKIVQSMGIEVMDVSSAGCVSHQQIIVKENYQIPFSESIRKHTGIITGAVGLIQNARQAENILQNDQADLIFIGRGFLKNPHLATQFAHELGDQIDWLPQYERGKYSL